MIRVVLIDSLALVRTGVRRLLQSAGDIDVVAEGATAEDATRLVKELRPDVLVLDGGMVAAPQAIRTVKQLVGSCEIVVLTNLLHQAEAAQVTAAGASGYVCRDVPAHALIAVLRAVSEKALPRDVRSSEDGVSKGPRARGTRPQDLSTGNGLTARELDILGELTRGRTDQEIAEKLLVGEGTVKTHVRHILHKLGVRNRTAATAYALRRRLIE